MKQHRQRTGRPAGNPGTDAALSTAISQPETTGRTPDSIPPFVPAPADPDQNRIAQRAYQMWEDDGRPDGADQQYWFAAEQALRREPGAPFSDEASPALARADNA